MGDLIDLQARIATLLNGEELPEHEAFLLTEGLELLADFRSIEDAAVRDSIRRMVARIAEALRRG